MRGNLKWAICTLQFAIVLLFALTLLSPAPAAAPPAPPGPDVHDFVFLAEARPVLLRMHVRVDGKSVRQAWKGFVKHLFAYLDVNGDGVLDKAEAERVPSAEQVRGGLLVGLGGGNRPSLAELDTDKDGKVSLAELASYYRKKGLVPFRVEADASGATAALAFFGVAAEPSVTEVSEAIFAQLDADKDGKLTQKELARAPEVLLRLDTDEDELITARELVPNPKSARGGAAAAMRMMARPGRGSSGNKLLVAVDPPGQAPADLVRLFKERYAPKKGWFAAKKLGRKELGLDEATFRRLDANGDGVLDDKELAGFVKRPADLELLVRLESGEARVEVVKAKGGTCPLAGKVKAAGALALLDLGKTRAELLGDEEEGYGAGPLDGIVRQQYLAQFRGADKDGNGYLDAKEAKASPVYRNLFKAMDRDGDGKLYEKEVLAYLDQITKLQERAMAACVSLTVSDQSRGLFALLDVNRDGRLSVREMRGAAGLLKELDRSGKGYLTRADLPHNYRLAVRRGQDLGGQVAAIKVLYGGSYRKKVKESAKGPLWFRKMDRNRDGDVSRKEFLFGEELFKKIDTDGDGLISLEEAQKAEALLASKLAEQKR
jgi:Ca2+-binding EF-hand superfamily protein